MGPDGQRVDEDAVARIRSLAIPPAWTDVRICPDPAGYLQATGRDARGRKQYRYHPDWRRRRDRAKYRRLLDFAEALPAIRRRVEEDLALPGLPREKVLALVVRLLELTYARVGNPEYARANRSFGITTLRNGHATVSGSAVRLRFRGKAGKVHEIGIRDRRVARLVRRCQELPGRELFEYTEPDGTVRSVRSEDVNAYLRDAAGADVTAKMFRTWAATVLAYRGLRDSPTPEAERGRRRVLAAAMAQVADELGNTPAVVRGSYVDPRVVDAFEQGRLGRPEGDPGDDGPHPAPGDAGDAGAGGGNEEGVGPRAWTPADEAGVLALLRAGHRGRRPART